jgi:hypothetical protein
MFNLLVNVACGFLGSMWSYGTRWMALCAHLAVAFLAYPNKIAT